MPTVRLDGRDLGSPAAFHDACRDAFGFPAFYGRTMDAWIDCLSGLRDGDGMTRFSLAPRETLTIEVHHAQALHDMAPAILAALKDGVDEVNLLYTERGELPALHLILH